jgi:REP element-mobilizing transposase RayT
MRITRSGWIISLVYVPRIEVPGGFYHVCTRGNDRQAIFLSDLDRSLFLLLLKRAARRFGWTIYAYCLMTNHYHLLVQLGNAGFSKGMCELNGGYALTFNGRHGRSNHVFGRRFWSDLIETDSHLLAASRYIVLNPVRAGLRRKPEDWPWSSYRASAGLEHAPGFLAVGELLRLFARNPEVARHDYRSYVSAGHGERQPPWTEAHVQQPPWTEAHAQVR